VVEAFGPSVEVVVADGGSKDRTVELAEGRARIVSAPRGRGRQLNEGAQAALGDLLVFLHADTRLSPGAGTALSEALAQGEIVGGCFKVKLRGPSARLPAARALAAAINWRSRRLHTATGDQAIFARRTAFDRVGGYPDDELFEDVLFYRGLKRLGPVLVLDLTVSTSDRRWRTFGYTRTIATHLLLRILFLMGVPPARLARLYRRVR